MISIIASYDQYKYGIVVSYKFLFLINNDSKTNKKKEF